MSPYSWAKGRLGCIAGKHERSSRAARRNADTELYESVCSYCGVPMVRLAKRNWIVKPKRD